MHSVLLGFLLIWGASFLIFAWLIWRAPVMEELLDDDDLSGPSHPGHGRGSEQIA
jgi:hypothetical protein